jgi:hypothetical protein
MDLKEFRLRLNKNIQMKLEEDTVNLTPRTPSSLYPGIEEEHPVLDGCLCPRIDGNGNITISVYSWINPSGRNNMPPVFSREEASKLLGGLISANSLRNLDCQHKGPDTKVRIGKKVLYERDSFINWLKKYRRCY